MQDCGFPTDSTEILSQRRVIELRPPPRQVGFSENGFPATEAYLSYSLADEGAE